MLRYRKRRSHVHTAAPGGRSSPCIRLAEPRDVPDLRVAVPGTGVLRVHSADGIPLLA